MDKDMEDLKSLGFFGISGEAYRLILSWRDIFSKITFAFIVPLSFLFFASMEIANLMSKNVQEDQNKLQQILTEGGSLNKELAGVIYSKSMAILLFYLAYIIFALIISLLSTSAVVYTVACIYVNDHNNKNKNNEEISFSNVMYVVPKVWNRLIITFLWICLVQLGYNFTALLVLVGLVIFFPEFASLVIVLLICLYIVGLICINTIWNLASVVSVLEEDMCGFNAIKKSMALIKGKLSISSTIFFIVGLLLFIIHAMILDLLASEDSWGGGVIVKLLYSMAYLLFMVIVILADLVIQSVIYFVCKSYHNEKIDKTSLDDHLKAYLEEYVPLNEKPGKIRQVQIV